MLLILVVTFAMGQDAQKHLDPDPEPPERIARMEISVADMTEEVRALTALLRAQVDSPDLYVPQSYGPPMPEPTMVDSTSSEHHGQCVPTMDETTDTQEPHHGPDLHDG